jgi:hypothetical protein
MTAPITNWKFKELQTWMDGGSVTPNYTCQNGTLNSIELVQNVLLEYYPNLAKIPGRIYVNNKLVEKRSIEEETVIQRLKLDIKSQETLLDKRILREKIRWIVSDYYLEISAIILKERKRQLQWS